MASELNSGAKYILSLVELRRARTRGGENAPPWEDKSVYNFYIELTTGEALHLARVYSSLTPRQIS